MLYKPPGAVITNTQYNFRAEKRISSIPLVERLLYDAIKTAPDGLYNILEARLISQNAHSSRDIYFQFMKYLRSVISPIIIQINASWTQGGRSHWLDKLALFSVENMAKLINLKTPDQRNNEVFVVLFSLLFARLKNVLIHLKERKCCAFSSDEQNNRLCQNP